MMNAFIFKNIKTQGIYRRKLNHVPVLGEENK